MIANVYDGMTKENLIFSRDISRYSYQGNAIALTLTGGLLVETLKNGQIVSVEIIDNVNGNVNKICKYTSYSFVVFDNPSTGEKNIIGDNSLLFEVLM